MSGIAGVFRRAPAGDATRGATRALLVRLAGSLAARGPDGMALWQEDGAALVHTLFETRDRDAAGRQHQPLNSGDLVIAADARIDARAHLVSALRSAGAHILPDDDDAALLLAAYRIWGDACVEHIIGDFAFVIWDTARRRVFAARDQFGVKPLYYAQTADELIIANTLETVLVHPHVARVLDDEAVLEFLLFGYNTRGGSTTYAQVKCLPAAHSLVLEHGTVRVTRYWSLPTRGELRYARPRDYADHFNAIFHEAVSDRMPRDEFAVLLSGGTDSTAVAATACKLLAARNATSPQPHAVCGGFRSLFADAEPHYAALAASALNLPFTFVPLDKYSAYDGYDSTPRTPEPYDNALFAAEGDLNAAVAARARVALTGNGGDALLRETRSHLWRLIMKGKPLTASGEAVQYARLHRKLPRPGVRTWLKERRGALLPPGMAPAWLQPDLAHTFDVKARIAAFERRPRDVHPLRPEAFVHLSGAFWPRYFEECDPQATRLPLELRHPFLDVRLVDFALSVPPAQWYNDKGVLRLAMQQLLPRAILRRGKAPLAGDPLLAVRKRDGASWLGARRVTDRIAPYVRSDMLSAEVGGHAQHPASVELDAELRPLTLSLWLS